MDNHGRFPHARLSTVIEGFEAGVSVLAEDRVPRAGEHAVLKVSSIGSRRFHPDESKPVLPSELNRLGPSIQSGDLLISRANTLELVGAAARVEVGNEHIHLSDKTWRARLSQDEPTRRWLLHVLNSPRVRAALRKRATGTSGSMKNISQAAYLAIEIPVPPPEERHRIARVLDDFDAAISRISDLLDAKRRLRRALLQRLIAPTSSGEIVGHSKPRRLGDLFVERTETNRSDLPLLAVTSRRGVVLRSELDRRDSSNPNKTAYLRVAPGDIVYNTMRMWQGVSARSELEGIVSPAYTVCIPNDEIDGHFAAVLFKHEPIVHLFHRHSQGLVDDTLSLKFDSFARIKVGIPPLDEQKKIADVFCAIDRELDLLERLRDALSRQHHGLLDKLLSGELRVPAR